MVRLISFISDVDKQRLFGEHWRRKPLFIPGGANGLLEPAITAEELRSLATELEQQNPTLVQRDRNRTLFAQHIDLVSARLRELVDCASEQLGQDAWLDGSVMGQGATIGSHYDDSDNFILQQSGTKLWRLHPPDIIPKIELRRRMLRDSGVGNIHMPGDAAEYLLKPGDLLYIPIFWPHWGISRGNSISLSVVCNSTNALDELLPIVIRHLIKNPEWWRPLPSPRVFSDRVFARERLFRELLTQLASDDLRGRVLSEVKYRRSVPRTSPIADRLSRAAVADEIVERRGVPPNLCLSFDMDKLRTMFAERCDDLDISHLVMPRSHNGSDVNLHRLLSLAYLKRFLTVCHKMLESLADELLARSLIALVDAFQRLPPSVMLATVTRPELTSWIFHSNDAVQHGYAPRLQDLVRHLGSFLLPPLIAEDVLNIGWSALIARSRLREIDFGAIACDAEVEDQLPDSMRVTRTIAGLVITDNKGSFVAELSLPIELGHEFGTGRARWVAKAHLTDCGPVFLRRHAWYEDYFPRDAASRASSIHFDITDEQFLQFTKCMSSGAYLIRSHWPEAWEELARRIHVIAPLEPMGLHPHNASVHGFRGLITSSPRPSYLAAQTLVHEAGHNKFSSICDLFPLFENDEGAGAYSPFTESQRPLPAVAHGIFAFIQDLHISVRMRGNVAQIEHLSLERYIAKVRAAVEIGIDNLKSEAVLTKRGEQLVAGFEAALLAGT